MNNQNLSNRHIIVHNYTHLVQILTSYEIVINFNNISILTFVSLNMLVKECEQIFNSDNSLQIFKKSNNNFFYKLINNQVKLMDQQKIQCINPNSLSQTNQDVQIKKLSKGQKKKLRQQKKKNNDEPQKDNEQEKDFQQNQNVSLQPSKKEDAGILVNQKNTTKGKDNKQKKNSKAAIMAKEMIEKKKKIMQQLQKKKKQEQLQAQKQRIEQQQTKRKQKQQKQKQERQEQERIKFLKEKGLYFSRNQQQKIQKSRKKLQQMMDAQLQNNQGLNSKLGQKQQIMIRDEKADFQLVQGKYRSPVCCILGHVDTGKTTLLDKIRRTKVQQKQAGGITQQIGATFFPHSKLAQQVRKCKSVIDIEVQIPGLLIIDTPGHESFMNLRSRGSSLCDIAILVIDIQHGLEQQTLQSLELLKKNNIPFIVALNKIDRSYGWEAEEDCCSYESLKRQSRQTAHDYEDKLDKTILQLNKKGYNATMYWENQDVQDYISLVPTSGKTGEGIPDLLANIVKACLSRQEIVAKIEVRKNRFKCTIMEVKMTEGYGTTIDCLLVDGSIKIQDQIVLLGFQGPIATKVKALLTPHPMKEMRVKDQYLHHERVYAANGIKIAANGLEHAVAGSPLFVANSQQQLKEATIDCRDQLPKIQKKFKLSTEGVGVAASTLGSLQALLEYLKTQKIPVSHISIGPISKQNILKAMKSILSESPQNRKQQYACILAFDVKMLPDAKLFAQQNNIKIFSKDIIYHLTSQFKAYVEQNRRKRKQVQGKDAVFPCILKQVATFRKSDPIILGVDVQEGVLKIGTPICVYNQSENNEQKQILLGVVEQIQCNKKPITQARKQTGSVAISLRGESNIMSGRHFEQKDTLASLISKRSTDCLKQYFQDQITKEDKQIMQKLAKHYKAK